MRLEQDQRKYEMIFNNARAGSLAGEGRFGPVADCPSGKSLRFIGSKFDLCQGLLRKIFSFRFS
jgi:hypothetical protein